MATPSPKTVQYLDKNVKISPRKLRLLAQSVKKLSPQQALVRLQFKNSKSARILHRAIKNIIADSTHNFSLKPDSLGFVTINVDQGPKFKRMDKSHSSRFARGVIQKRHSRLKIIIKGKTTENGPKSQSN